MLMVLFDTVIVKTIEVFSFSKGWHETLMIEEAEFSFGR